jgi:hypothetical protein
MIPPMTPLLNGWTIPLKMRDSPSKSSASRTLVRRALFFRARALQDFAYALVKAEMDTDFEDECKEIVSRRQKATEKLKKIDKDHPELAPVSPSKMQVPMFISFFYFSESHCIIRCTASHCIIRTAC